AKDIAMTARKIAAIVFIAVLVAVALVFALGIPAGFLIAAVSDRVEANTGYRLRVAGHSKLTFWPAVTFLARDIKVRNARDAGSSDQFTAQSLQVWFAPASLLSGHLRISAISIGHPVLQVPLPRERTSVPVSGGPGRTVDSKTSGASRVSVDRVTVTDGTIELVGQTGNFKSR